MAMDSSLEEADRLVLCLQQDPPAIEVSVKNLIAILHGLSASNSICTKGGGITLQSAMMCGKLLLKTIQEHQLPTLEEFQRLHPQEDDQLGIDRIEEILRYKVVASLRKKVDDSSVKVWKLFGKKYLLWSRQWSAVRAKVENALSTTNVSPEEWEFFLNSYERSLLESAAADGQEAAMNGRRKADVNLEDQKTAQRLSSDDVALIWTANMADSLRRRQAERSALVEKRQEEISRDTVKELVAEIKENFE